MSGYVESGMTALKGVRHRFGVVELVETTVFGKFVTIDPMTPSSRSQCSPNDDDWSASGMDVPAKGGGTQRVIGDRSGTTSSEE